MDREKLEKAADIASDNAVFESHPWNVFNDGFIKGAEWLQSQPLADRMTEEERVRVRDFMESKTNEPIDVSEFVYEIFGKEMFEKRMI